MLRILAVSLLAALAVSAGKPKNTGPFKNENQSVEISATPILDKEEIKQILGSDLDGHYILVKVTVAPKFGGQVDIHRDDFVLKTDKDGERSSPYVASQIAGRGSLIVTQTAGQGTSGGPQFGSPYDYPAYGAGVGGGPTQITEAHAKMQTGSKDKEKDKESPLMATLNEKMLPEKKADGPVSGYLYFALEKQKQKDLELIYTTPDGKLTLRFR